MLPIERTYSIGSEWINLKMTKRVVRTIPEAEFDLLLAECKTSATLLSTGLTTIGAIQLPDEGALTGSLFMLSIGLERLLKVLLLLLTFENAGNWSVNAKSFSHNISRLMDQVITLSDNKSSFNSATFSDSVIQSIIIVLTEFALNSRYSNIDTLTGKHVDSPLVHWSKDVEDQIFQRHRRLPDAFVERRMELAQKLESIVIARRYNYDGTLYAGTVAQLLVQGKYRIVSRHVKVYIGRIIRELCRLLYDLDLVGMDCLRELVRYFYCDDSYYRTTKKFKL